MRIFTTLLIFGLSSVVFAAPRPMNVRAAQALSSRAVGDGFHMIERDESLIHARDTTTTTTTTTTTVSQNSKNPSVITFIGKQGVPLKGDQAAKIQKALTNLFGSESKFKIPNPCRYLDKPDRHMQTAPGEKPPQIVTFSATKKKGGTRRGYVNLATGVARFYQPTNNKSPRPQSGTSRANSYNPSAPGSTERRSMNAEARSFGTEAFNNPLAARSVGDLSSGSANVQNEKGAGPSTGQSASTNSNF